jgi:pyruvate dehydrogenase E2 component (dihydrolipoamide acetyltransferase)
VAHVLIMPRQGNTVESCIITRWIAGEGDPVSAEDAVCEVETDKASFDVSAGAAGVVLKILRAEGEDVPVLEPIAVIGVRGEDWKAALSAEPSKPRADDAQAVQEAVQAAQAAVKAAHAAAKASPPADAPGVSPRARSRAEAESVDASALPGTGPGGRVIERDVAAAAASRPAMTSAARAAVASGAAAPSGPGSALGGRVGLADLGPAVAAPKAAGAAAGLGAFTDTPLKGVRKIISERMLGSLSSTAQLTFNGSAPAARILDLRARFKAGGPSLGLSDVTIGDLVLFAASRVLTRFPGANATLEGGVLRSYERVHLALAVDTPRGLMVPVVRNADLLSLRELSAEAKRLAAACQSGSIDPADLSGGTFTVTNLGAFGVESFTPVLNAPQVAILGVDAITQRAAAGPGAAVVLEPRMGLSLTVDHQIVDGAPAARLLKAFADAIADIDLLLMA